MFLEAIKREFLRKASRSLTIPLPVRQLEAEIKNFQESKK